MIAAIPNVPRKSDPEQRRFDDAVRGLLTDMLVGKNRAIRTGDLSDGSIQFPFPPELTDRTVPPQVVNLKASGAFQNIILTWDFPAYGNHAFTRLYRATVDDFALAQPLATPGWKVFADPVGGDQTFYYWAANVSRSGVEGPLNGVAGTRGFTMPDLDELLKKLEGEVLESLLTKDLQEKIALIDAPATIGGSVNDRLAKEAKKTADRIAEEVLAREDGDSTNKYALEAFGVQVRGDYKGTDLSQVTHGLIASERDARKTETGALAQQVSLLSAGVAGTFDPLKTWYFDGGVEGWSGTGANVSYSTGQLVIDATAADGGVETAFTAVKAEQYPVVRARIRRTAGSGWDGRLRWSRPGHGFSASYERDVNVSIAIGQWAVVEWDMSDNADWMAGDVTGLQLLLSPSAGDDFAMDWISVGRNGPAASVAQVLDEARVRAEKDTAEATARQSLTVKLVGTADLDALPNLTAVTSGFLADEKKARVDADKAETERRETLSSKMLGTTDPLSITDLGSLTSGLLYDERKTRADAVSAEARSRVELEAVVKTKGRVFWQDDAPATGTEGDVWYDTNDKNQAYRWGGSGWVAAPDGRIEENRAAIVKEGEARATDKQAVAKDIETLSAAVTKAGTDAGALVQGERDARAELGRVLAQATTTVQGNLDKQALSVQQSFKVTGDSITGLQGQYTVKIDNGGRVSGFGLASDVGGSSLFNVLADRFAITIPGINGGAASVPFVAGVVNGQARIVMSSAWIADAAIQRAMIGEAAIDDAKIANLDAAKITSGFISADRLDVNVLVAKLASIDTAFIKNANIENLTLGTEKFKPNSLTEAGVFVTGTDAAASSQFQVYYDMYDAGNRPVATTMNCKKDGCTVLWFNLFIINNRGNDYDRFLYRIIRKGPGGNIALPGEPKIGPAKAGETFAWTFIDTSIPVDGSYTYQVQMYKTNGSRPQMDQMSLVGVQFKR